MSVVRRWRLGRTHREQADFIGEKVEYLFRQVPHPTGREYTVAEVADAIGTPVSYVADLRGKRISDLGRERMDALNTFFGVDSGYWFRAMNYIDEHDPNYPHFDRPEREWTPEDVEMLARMLAHVQAHVAALRGDPGAQDAAGRPTP
jgi:hypothetical protein